jgi:pimeloyl-ACP methyl ester carboxylesterase
MPVTFDPDRLRESLRPLVDAQPLSAEARVYQRFYGLDLAARKVAVPSRLGRFEVDGFEVVAQVWWPPVPVATMFMFHGFYDHMGLYRHVLDWALDQGFVVIACDFPGHGLSSGARASIDDFAVYQDVMQALFAQAQALSLPQPWHLFGQSTGAAVVVDHLLNHGIDSPAQGKTFLLAPWCGRVAGGGRRSAITCCARSSKASRGGSAKTPTTRRSSRSWRPIRCSPASCPPPGSAPWCAGSNVSKPPAQPKAAVDRAGRRGHDGGLAAQLAGAAGQVR